MAFEHYDETPYEFILFWRLQHIFFLTYICIIYTNTCLGYFPEHFQMFALVGSVYTRSPFVDCFFYAGYMQRYIYIYI